MINIILSIKEVSFQPVGLANIVLKTFFLSGLLAFMCAPVIASNGSPKIKLQPKVEPLQIGQDPAKIEPNEPVEIPYDLALMSKTLTSMIGDLALENLIGPKGQAVPVDIDRLTLKAVIETLKGLDGLKKNEKEPKIFPNLKKLVEKAFASNETKAQDFKNLLIAINNLDIPDLMIPAAAVYVDKILGAKAKTPADIKPILEKIKLELKENLPADLLPLAQDYLDWLTNPNSFLDPIIIPDMGGDLIFSYAPENKIYVANFNYELINVFDTEKNEKTGKIEIEPDVSALARTSNKLYASTFEDGIFVFDSKTNKVIEEPIKILGMPVALATFDSKLYVANYKSNIITVIDTNTNKILGEPIVVGKSPASMAISGTKLYVANSGDGTVSVIDTNTNKILGKPIVVGKYPRGMAISGTKLYVANSGDRTVSLIDTKTDQATQLPMNKEFRSGVTIELAISGNYLLIATQRDNKYDLDNFQIAIFDITANKIIGQLIVMNKARRHSFTTLGKNIYVISPLSTVPPFKNEMRIFDLTKVLKYGFL